MLTTPSFDTVCIATDDLRYLGAIGYVVTGQITSHVECDVSEWIQLLNYKCSTMKHVD